MDRSCYFGFGFDRAIPAISLARETPRSFQFVGLDTLRRQGYAPQPGLYSDRKVSTRIYIYIYKCVEEDSGEGGGFNGNTSGG